ncbi:MAG: peptidase [Chloroflexi bacterium]|nr:peptidase [Chloroflexota bacterium]|tara:strand:- start:899 stop:2833 length:1935 start_codon:yes stop_codon:yes gene_type:complete
MKSHYGSWESTITPEKITEGGLRFSEIRSSGSDLYFLEGRPEESGRYVIVKQASDGKISDVIPKEFNSRNAVHEYGGGSYAVGQKNIYFTNWDDQRIYKVNGENVNPITKEPPFEKSIRYSDLTLSIDEEWLFCVRETHFEKEEAKNELVAISTTENSQIVLCTGRDFYSSPRINPTNKEICWLEWDHPNMPWDGTELFIANFDLDGLSEIKFIDGSKNISIIQPEWSDSGELIYISDESGWWNLKKYSENTNSTILNEKSDHGGPSWQFGFRTYFVKDNNIYLKGISKNKNKGLIRKISISGQILETNEVFHTSINDLTHHKNKALYIGASPVSNSEIVSYDLMKKNEENIKESNPVKIDIEEISIPEEISFPTTQNAIAYGYFYKPKNKNFQGESEEKPPLLVISHGGPTSATSNALNLSIQYWTNRGIAVADVNYRGSTGYGKKFRDSLKGNWGVYDTDDCIAAVDHLSEKGLVDSSRVAIKGGSAGGYTTINALTFHDRFAVGATYYGIADLSVFIDDTHKFESKYLESLIGKYPEEKEKYYERSAINFTDQLSCPMIIFQGTEDKIVPPSQAEIMAQGLRDKKIPFSLIMYEGEQHGFRQSKNIISSLESEIYFYSKVLGFKPFDKLKEVEIENSENLK